MSDYVPTPPPAGVTGDALALWVYEELLRIQQELTRMSELIAAIQEELP